MFPGGSTHNLVLIVMSVAAALGTIAYLRRHNKSRACTICGKPCQFGFSYHAEFPMKEIEPAASTARELN
jgi:hypothetical protein